MAARPSGVPSSAAILRQPRPATAGPASWSTAAVRDVAELRPLAIGVRALGLMPQRSMKRGEGERDVPVTIQGVAVRPGHWLYADEDGIVVSVRALT